jgi:hypothetical protein
MYLSLAQLFKHHATLFAVVMMDMVEVIARKVNSKLQVSSICSVGANYSISLHIIQMLIHQELRCVTAY